MRSPIAAKRLVGRVVGALVLAASVLLSPSLAAPAGAHSYWATSDTIRIAGCAVSSKYGCQSYFLNPESTPTGSYYVVQHSHICTNKGGDSTQWSLYSHATFYTQHDMAFYAESRNPKTTGWCAQGATDSSSYSWFPNVQALVGNNQFWVNTDQWFPGPIFLTCKHQILNFNRFFSVDPVGHNAGAGCL